MSITVHCPECDRDYQVRDELAGRKGRCPRGHSIRVPVPAAAAEDADAPTADVAATPTDEYADTGSAFGAEEFAFPTQLAGASHRASDEAPARKTGRTRRPEAAAIDKRERAAGKPSQMPLILGGVIGLIGLGAGVAMLVVSRGQAGPLQEQAAAAEKKAAAAEERAKAAESNRLLVEAELDKLKKHPPKDPALDETRAKLKAAEKRATDAERKLAALPKAGAGGAAMPGKEPDPNAPGGKNDPVLPGGKLVPDQPKKPDPKMDAAAPKGGKNWTAPESLTFGQFNFVAGDRLWLWPQQDAPLKAEGGKLTIKYRWQLRPGKELPAKLGAVMLVVDGGMIFSTATQIGLTGESGEAEATFDAMSFSGKLPVSFFLSDGNLRKPTVYSTILGFETDFGPPAKK